MWKHVWIVMLCLAVAVSASAYPGCKCKAAKPATTTEPTNPVNTVYVNADMNDPQPMDVNLGHGWSLGHSTSIPLMRVVEANGPGSSMVTEPLIGFGAGPAFNWTSSDQTGDVNKSIVCITPLMLVLSYQIAEQEELSLSVGPVVGFFDNALQMGCLYNFGPQEYERSRFEMVFSVGPSILKNLR